MKLIGLARMARDLGKDRRTLLRELEALEETTPHLRGLVIVRGVGQRKKIRVNVAVLDHIRDVAVRKLSNEVAELKAHLRQAEARIEELEAAHHAA